MTTLEPTTKEPTVPESPKGDIFLSKIRRGEPSGLPRRATTDCISESLSELLDLSKTSTVVDEIRSLTDSLANLGPDSEKLAVEIMRSALEQATADLEAILKAHEGVWALTYTCPPVAPNVKTQGLVDNYGVTGSEAQHTALFLSHHEITDVGVLPYPISGTLYQPAMNVRIRTDQDQPTQYFGPTGNIEDRPSDGSWFKFDLRHTTVHLLN